MNVSRLLRLLILLFLRSLFPFPFSWNTDKDSHTCVHDCRIGARLSADRSLWYKGYAIDCMPISDLQTVWDTPAVCDSSN